MLALRSWATNSRVIKSADVGRSVRGWTKSRRTFSKEVSALKGAVSKPFGSVHKRTSVLYEKKEIRRRYCEEVEEEEPNKGMSEQKEAIVEPLRWGTSSSVPNLLKEKDLEGKTKGVQVQRAFEKAKRNVKELMKRSFEMNLDGSAKRPSNEKVLVVYDKNSILSRILAQAYGTVLDESKSLMVDFETTTVDQLKATIDTMKEGDMVVLVQSNGFRLNDYRLRIELFKVGIKNLEHAHLDMMPNCQVETYIDTLAFVPDEETKRLAHELKRRMDKETRFVIRSRDGSECYYECGLEPALLNIGDYKGMKGIGGTFPVGEVFSEPKSLDSVNGKFSVFGFPNKSFDMQHLVQPFNITIAKGRLVATEGAPDSFLEILEAIRTHESADDSDPNPGILIREFGVGLNPHIGRHAPLQNVTAFERQAGFHISLGRKHTVFKKSGISHKKSRFHIDVFIDLDEIQMGDDIVFKYGKFTI